MTAGHVPSSATQLQHGRSLTPEEDTAHEELVMAIRGLQDAFAGADAPPHVLRDLADRAHGLVASLMQHQVAWQDQVTGWRMNIPGRGQTLTPPLTVTRYDKKGVSASFQFSRFYLGGGGYIHGGTIPLVADELFGQWAQAAYGGRTRTAYLKVDYRKVTPLDAPLVLEGWPLRQEGRKLYISGRLMNGSELLCDLDALFIGLRDGQP